MIVYKVTNCINNKVYICVSGYTINHAKSCKISHAIAKPKKMKLKDFLLLDATLSEKIIIVLTVVVFAFIFAPREERIIDDTPIIGQEFEEYPLIAWKSTQKKWNGQQGNIVKIKYRVTQDKTFIQVLDDKGKVVHKQPIQRSPWDDGRSRDFTYVWMLYATEDYGDEILPGEYQIQVCHKYSRNVDMVLDITI